MNIQIKQANKYGEMETIADIDIKNGNWKYWDTYMETTEKQTLTINNIQEMNLINQPVKDAIGIHDKELWENERELVISDASVRTYQNLLSYLNYRINNTKEDYKKWGRSYNRYTAVLYDEEFYLTKDEDVVRNITYKAQGLIEIKIKVMG